jgi:hypothetical protein
MATTEYQRLTSSRARSSFAVAFMARTSLWLGADHLLFVESNGYTEAYKRFYFRDIQALVVQKTQKAAIINAVLAIPLVLILPFALGTQALGLKIFLFSLAGLFALILLVNLLLGRTCRCFLRTAVQIEQLPPLDRLGRAQKVFARLRPLIAAAQGGELSPETISELMRQQASSSEAGSTVSTGNPAIPPRVDS